MNLNGSVAQLAIALKAVFEEAMEPVNENMVELEKRMVGMEKGMGEMEERLKAHIDAHIDTTNQNLQAQLAAHRLEVKDERQAQRSAVAALIGPQP